MSGSCGRAQTGEVAVKSRLPHRPRPTADALVALRVLSAGAVHSTVTRLTEGFSKASGHQVEYAFGTVGAVLARLEAGESPDLIILTPAAIDRLIDGGSVVRGSRVDLGTVGAGLAVRHGAPKPDIGSVAAFRQTMLDAKSVAYGDPSKGASSGIHLAKVLEQLGIADRINGKGVLRPSGFAVMEALAGGEAEIGITQISEILASEGVELAGRLPMELRGNTTYSAALMTKAAAPEAAKALIAYLTTPAARAAFTAAGFDPPDGE